MIVHNIKCPECGYNIKITQNPNHSEYTPMGYCKKCDKYVGAFFDTRNDKLKVVYKMLDFDYFNA